MRGRRCTIDSSCLIALDHAGVAPQLSMLFQAVLVPKAVRAELSRRRGIRDRLKVWKAELAFVEWCDEYDAGAVDLMLIELSKKGGQDRGEAEAVVQAAQVGAAVLIDDRWGRQLAQNFRLEYHGSLWVLERLHEMALLSPMAVREAVRRMQEQEIRLPGEAVEELLRRIGT